MQCLPITAQQRKIMNGFTYLLASDIKDAFSQGFIWQPLPGT
jgi:hypothetical protein